MLTTKPTSVKSILEVLHDNKVVVGKFICEVDGYWYFLPGSNNNGLFAEHNLREIADLLRGLNATIEKELKEYCGYRVSKAIYFMYSLLQKLFPASGFGRVFLFWEIPCFGYF